MSTSKKAKRNTSRSGRGNKNKFQSKHNLEFEVSPWEYNIPNNDMHCEKFRIGTCDGLYGQHNDFYVIIAIVNSVPGNGHFDDVLEWFERSCKRDKKALVIAEIWNEKFKAHLINKRGFVNFGDSSAMKGYYDNSI